MKYIYSVLLVLCIVAFSEGCKDNVSASDDSIQDIFPLKVGDRWTYHIEEWLNTNFKVTDTIGDIVVQEQAVFKGHQGYLYSLGDTNNENIVYYSGSDLFIVNESNSSTIVLRYPMTTNQKLVLTDTTYPDGSRLTKELVYRQDNEPITVPAGQISCVHYDRLVINYMQNIADTSLVRKLYFTKGIDFVLEEEFEKHQGKPFMIFRESLLSYSLK